MKIFGLKTALTAAMLAISSFASAYSNVYVFGDSLSDNGNLNAIAPDQTYGERFSNGPLAVEVVAGALGFSLSPSLHLAGLNAGTNYAIAGAKAVDEDGNEATPDINLPTQVNAFLQANGGVSPSDALYIVLIGGNDIRDARSTFSASIFAETREERKAIRKAAKAQLKTAADEVVNQINKLIATGAQNILVANAPNIGVIPETGLVQAGLAAQATTNKQERRVAKFPHRVTILSAFFNRKLARALHKAEKATGVDFITYDLFGFLNDQIANGEDLGYTNVEEPCFFPLSQGGALNPTCDFPTATGFLFFDEIHPTTMAQQAAGAEIVQTLLAQ